MKRHTALAKPSPSLVRREREKAATRDAILNAARELFVTDGIEATTMRAIATRIGYTATAIYHHFRDKDALLEELCSTDFQALGAAMHRIGRIEDPIDRLRKLGFAYANFALDNPGQYRFMFMTQQRQLLALPSAGAPMKPDHAAYDFLLQTVTEGIQEGRFRSELTDPHQTAQVMWSGIHGVVSLWLTHCNDPYIEWRPPMDTVRLIVDVMVRGAVVESESETRSDRRVT